MEQQVDRQIDKARIIENAARLHGLDLTKGQQWSIQRHINQEMPSWDFVEAVNLIMDTLSTLDNDFPNLSIADLIP